MELGYTRLPPPLGIFCLNDFADFVFTPAPFTEKSSQNFPGVVYCQKIKINWRDRCGIQVCAIFIVLLSVLTCSSYDYLKRKQYKK